MSATLDRGGPLSLYLLLTALPIIRSDNDHLCTAGEDCNVLCDESSSCKSTVIQCPMNFQCSITCSSSYSCYQSTINATASSLFTLNGCDSNNSCSSISIYFPSHDSGAPRGIIQMDNSLTADVVDYSFIDVSFYAENGWSDIDISSYNGQFQNDHQGVMHCSPDYSLQCEFGRCSNTCDDYIAEEMEGSTSTTPSPLSNVIGAVDDDDAVEDIAVPPPSTTPNKVTDEALHEELTETKGWSLLMGNGGEVPNYVIAVGVSMLCCFLCVLSCCIRGLYRLHGQTRRQLSGAVKDLRRFQGLQALRRVGSVPKNKDSHDDAHVLPSHTTKTSHSGSSSANSSAKSTPSTVSTSQLAAYNVIKHSNSGRHGRKVSPPHPKKPIINSNITNVLAILNGKNIYGSPLESIPEQPDSTPNEKRMGHVALAMIPNNKEEFRTGTTPTEVTMTDVTMTSIATSISSHSEIYREPGAGYNDADDEEKQFLTPAGPSRRSIAANAAPETGGNDDDDDASSLKDVCALSGPLKLESSQSLPMGDGSYDDKKRTMNRLKLKLGNITEPLRLSINEARASSLKSIRKWTNPGSSPSFEANSVGSNSDSETNSETEPMEIERSPRTNPMSNGSNHLDHRSPRNSHNSRNSRNSRISRNSRNSRASRQSRQEPYEQHLSPKYEIITNDTQSPMTVTTNSSATSTEERATHSFDLSTSQHRSAKDTFDDTYDTFHTVQRSNGSNSNGSASKSKTPLTPDPENYVMHNPPTTHLLSHPYGARSDRDDLHNRSRHSQRSQNGTGTGSGWQPLQSGGDHDQLGVLPKQLDQLQAEMKHRYHPSNNNTALTGVTAETNLLLPPLDAPYSPPNSVGTGFTCGSLASQGTFIAASSVNEQDLDEFLDDQHVLQLGLHSNNKSMSATLSATLNSSFRQFTPVLSPIHSGHESEDSSLGVTDRKSTMSPHMSPTLRDRKSTLVDRSSTVVDPDSVNSPSRSSHSDEMEPVEESMDQMDHLESVHMNSGHHSEIQSGGGVSRGMLSMWSGDLKEEDVPQFSGDSKSTVNSKLQQHVQRTAGNGDVLSVLSDLSEMDRANAAKARANKHHHTHSRIASGTSSGYGGGGGRRLNLTLGTSVVSTSVVAESVSEDEEKVEVLKDTLHTPQSSYQFHTTRHHKAQTTEYSTSFATSFIASAITMTSHLSAGGSSTSSSSSSSSESSSFAGSTYL